jgi:hypothetical protein
MLKGAGRFCLNSHRRRAGLSTQPVASPGCYGQHCRGSIEVPGDGSATGHQSNGSTATSNGLGGE